MKALLALSLFLFFTVAAMSFTTVVTPPMVTTVSGWSNFHVQATLNGSANANGEPTTGWFRYSDVNPGACSDTFGIRTPDISLGSRTVPFPYTQEISGLSLLTTYYFCAIAQNSSGIGFGEVMSFTTPAPPTVVTLAATDITSSRATLNASVNPNGISTQVYFRYGLQPVLCNELGTLTPPSPIYIGAGSSPVPVSVQIQGLFPFGTYYYCAVGGNLDGYTLGQVLSFHTLDIPPTISGAVTYGNAIGGPAPRYVSNATITVSGSVNGFITTGPPGPDEGRYAFTGLGINAFTITPSKTGGANGISSFDAALIAKHVAGTAPLTGNQLIVTDVSGDGSISSFDAAQIARYASGIGPPTGSTGTWRFSPAGRDYFHVFTDIGGQDYTALLMGEVSGNWTNTGARPR